MEIGTDFRNWNINCVWLRRNEKCLLFHAGGMINIEGSRLGTERVPLEVSTRYGIIDAV